MTSSRLPRPTGSPMVTVTVDGDPVQAYPGETVATVLLAAGRQTFRHTDHSARAPRPVLRHGGLL